MTLPSTWAQRNNLSPGDEINIVEQERNLMISTDKGPNLTSITLDITSFTPAIIWRSILSAYRAGYDEIIVTGFDDNQKSKRALPARGSEVCNMYAKKFNMVSPTDIIQLATSSALRSSFDWENYVSPVEVVVACVNRLIGMEIIEQRENYFKIKELGEATYKEFDNALRRIFLLLKLECECVAEALDGKKDKLRDILLIDTNLDRFEDFCMRVLSKRGYTEFRKTSTIHAIIFLLEMVGDELKKMSMDIMNTKHSIGKPVRELFEFLVKHIDEFYHLYYKYEKAKVLELYDSDKSSIRFAKSCSKNLSCDEVELIHHCRKIRSYVLNLTELRIDLEH